ncbi:MAG: tetratricopeptide repeat protein, partial [bacterium]|nr:tetratricopeptide repeat protein [bacterium]
HRIAARACLENNLFMEAFRHIEKARDYLGESEAISADFKVIKQKLANYVDELIGKANQAFEQNELEKAISLYSQVLKIDPENGEIYQKFKESRDLFTKEVSLNAALETLSKAEVLLRQEQWDEAVSLLDEAKSKAPWSDDVKQRVEAGKQVYQKYLDRIKVNEEAKQQKEEHKRQEAYYLERAKLFLMEENWDKAIEFYRKVIASNPANREAGQNLQEALNAKKLRTSFEEGTRYLASEEYEKAVEKFDFVYSKTPHSRTMLTRLCEALEQIGKTEEAISRYQTFIKNNPRAVDFYVKIGDLYSGKGNYAKAVTMYNIYLSKHTKDIKVGMKVADSYLLMGNDKEALATYRKFAKFEEGNLELREKMVALYLKAGNKKSALIELGSLVEKSNIVAKDAEYLYQMGKIFLEQQAYR